MSADLQRRGAMACAVAVALAGLVYLNTLHNPFIYDDFRLIVENRAHQVLDLRAILWHDITRPATDLSYAFDRWAWGGSPFGYHLTSVTLHMINTALFAWLAWCAVDDSRRRLTPAYVAAPAALLFAVHPLMTEAVGYISGRSEVLCATFFLLALHAARRALRSGGAVWYVVATLSWLVALASKETAVLFPVVLLLYDRWISAARGHRRLHATLIAIAVLLAGARLFVFAAIEHDRTVMPVWNLTWTELDVVRQYLTMLVVPAGQAIFHATTAVGPGDLRAWVAVMVIAALVIAMWRVRHPHPFFSFGVAWFLLLLVPSSALVILDRGEPMAEHRVYLASLGVFLIAGVLIALAARWLEARNVSGTVVLVASMTAVALPLGGRTVLRNQLWSSPLAVWLEAAERAPDHWFPPLLMGQELHRLGLHSEAVAAFRRSIAARSNEPGSYGALGQCLAELKDLDGAEAAFRQEKALDATSFEAANGLATVALLRGDLPAARAGYLETLKIDPANIAARRALAAIEEAPGGNPSEALRWCEDIRRLAPETPGNDDCIRRNQARVSGS